MRRLTEDEGRQIVRGAFTNPGHASLEVRIGQAAHGILCAEIQLEYPHATRVTAQKILNERQGTLKPSLLEARRMESASWRAFKYAKDMGLLTVAVKDKEPEREVADILRQVIADGEATISDLAASLRIVAKTIPDEQADHNIIHRSARENHVHLGVARWHYHRSSGTPEAAFVSTNVRGKEGKGATTVTGRSAQQKPNWQNIPIRDLDEDTRNAIKSDVYAAAFRNLCNFPIQGRTAFPENLATIHHRTPDGGVDPHAPGGRYGQIARHYVIGFIDKTLWPIAACDVDLTTHPQRIRDSRDITFREDEVTCAKCQAILECRGWRSREQRPRPYCWGCADKSQYRSQHTNAFCRWTINDIQPTAGKTCSRCKGTGRVPFKYMGGVCFKCRGQGREV